jgi:O-antigen/teichoic acid export membrane protein
MTLRQKVLRGGVYLAMREGCGMVLSLGGILLLTRIVGPSHYGLYAAALGVFMYTYYAGQFGILVYLVRRQEEEQQAYHQAFTLLLLIGLVILGVFWFGSSWLEQWMRMTGFGSIAKTLMAVLPIALINQVPLARLERNMDYRRIALIELANQFTYNLIALPLAFAGLGAWALVIGWCGQQLQAMILLFSSARYRPQIIWHWQSAKAMMQYSLGYSASLWAFQMRALVNPLIVGRFAGAEVVAYVALAARMVDVLSFVRSATYRISISALARLQTQPDRLRQALTDGMNLQILALGPLLVTTSWLGPIVVPLCFGKHWLPVTLVFPFIAASSLINSQFSLHSSALYVLQHNWEVAKFHLLHISLFAGTAFLLVPHLGLLGYGWAELATVLGYPLIHFYLHRAIGTPDYRVAMLWCGAFSLAMFADQLGGWVALPLIVVGLWSKTRQTIKQYIRQFREAAAG